MEEADVTGSLRVHVGGQDRVASHLAEAVEIQLPSEGREVGMLKVKREDRLVCQ
jgi:hypothetical protein